MDEKILKLVRYLKGRGLYAQFVANIKKFGSKTMDATMKECEDIHDLLLYSFDWEKTPEGADYWEHVDLEWCEYLDSESKK